jgi:hypothetical protein
MATRKEERDESKKQRGYKEKQNAQQFICGRSLTGIGHSNFYHVPNLIGYFV